MKNLFLLITFLPFFQTTIFSQEIRGTVSRRTRQRRSQCDHCISGQIKSGGHQAGWEFPHHGFQVAGYIGCFHPQLFEPYKVVVTEKTLADPNFEIVLLDKRKAMAAISTKRYESDAFMRSKKARVLDEVAAKEAAIEYDTIITFDPASYTESIKLVRRSDSKSRSAYNALGSSRAAASYASDASVKKEAAVEYDTIIVFEPETYEEEIMVVPKSDGAAYSYADVPPPAFRSKGSSIGFGGLDTKLSERAAASVVNGKTFIIKDSLAIPSGNQPRTKLLTAGEVNDFLKWEMWKDLSEAEFKQYSEYWGMMPKERFCVQLTNKQGDAIVGEPVSLIDRKSGKTLWRAVTDNTGKAELWANLFEKTTVEKLAIRGDGFEEKRPVAFHNGINHIEVKTACQTSNTVEIAFVVDATGSMKDELEFLKLELEDVIRNTFEQHAGLDLRAASVFYRDLGQEYVTRHVGFNNDLLKVLNFIKLQSAKAGGDRPEAVDSALHVALHQLAWSKDARTKILFLISDAPPHDYAIGKMKTLIEEAAALGVRIVPLACSGSKKSYEYLQRSMALATNGTYACLTDHSGIGGSHEEPTTDSYKVELLNNLLQRLIEQSIFVPECSENETGLLIDEIPIAFQANNEAALKSYPNPTSGNVKVELMSEMEAVYLTDFTGKILERLSVGKPVQQIDLSGYPSAVYFLAYFTKDGKRGTERIVLQRG